MNDITISRSVPSPGGIAVGNKSQPQSSTLSFGQMLTESINKVNRYQQAANTSINDLVTGKQNDIHETMIAMEKASVSFELLMQIRNKVISAYESIMRMPV